MSVPEKRKKYYRCYAEINLDAVSHNLAEIKKNLDGNTKILAVVKADAYGHGSVAVSKHIENEIDYFAVTSVEEAIEIRTAGITVPVLILSHISPLEYEEVLEYDITASVYNLDEAKILSDLATKKNKTVKIHIPVDTGMGRIGVTPDEQGALKVKEICSLQGIEVEGVFSHYACADSADKTEASKQTELFDYFLSLLSEKGIQIPVKHINNSAGTMELPKKYDMCRVGIALYGLYPSDEMQKEKISLVPAMEVFSHVVHVKTVPQGFKIGYGHIYEAPSERRIATVSIGYADGYNRCLTGVGYVLVQGKKAPVVGKICMDQMMIDVTDIENVKVGDTVTVMGKNGGEEISPETLGSMCNSFNYEVICNFMPRIKRIYRKNGKII